MASQLLQKADAEAIFDSIAQQYKLVLAAIGTTAAESNTLAKGADNFKVDILGIMNDDDNLWMADLADPAERYKTSAAMSAYFAAPAGDAIRAIERHVCKRDADYSSINDWLSDVGIRVHPYCKTIYSQIDAENTWPLTLDTTTGSNDLGQQVADLGVYTVSGAGVGALSALDSLDTGTYGDGLIMLVVTSAGGIGAGSNLVFTIVGKDGDGSSVQGTCTVTAGAALNTEFDVASIRFAEITSCTNTNGTTGDKVNFRFRDDRAPTL